MAPSDTPEPVLPPSAKKLTVKQEREARRQAKVEQYKKQQTRARRTRILAITLSSVAALAVVAVIVTVVLSNATPKRDPADIAITSIDTWPDIEFGHVETAVDYEGKYGTNPPAGGVHNPVWLNCGIYTEPQQNENAVHSLEHGAVWVTYNPDELSEGDIEELRSQMPDTYTILSPYPELDAPVVASAWGAQLKLDGVDDERLGDFIEKYWQAEDVPERGAPCHGQLDGPGKIS